MNIIVDAGSTKTDWFITDRSYNTIGKFTTDGINAALMERAHIATLLDTQLVPLLQDRPHNLHYYGAGCLPGAPTITIRELLTEKLRPTGEVEVASDMLCAARALCGTQPGIACILGTGSNSCLYDGCRIIDNVPAMGFILGDEGSGAVIGRNLVTAIAKRMMPDEVTEAFNQAIGLTTAQIIEAVYRRPAPNAFLASLVPFVAQNIEHPDIEALVVDAFTAFIHHNITRYHDWQHYPIHFSGSVAHVFSQQLTLAAKAYGFTPASIVQYPAQGIINYHKTYINTQS